jgi:large subunit ribosomal protein L32e
MEEEAIKQLTTLEGVGISKAKILYEAGYETIESIQVADEKDIADTKGIGDKLANKIKTFDDETKRLLDVRKKQKSKKPHFLQTDSHKKKKLKDYWRKPDGIHNKSRYHVKGKCPRVERGFGSPALVKGLHPSGFEEVIVNTPKDLDSMKGENQAVRIAHTVGGRKREIIEKKAIEIGLKILNPTRRVQ